MVEKQKPRKWNAPPEGYHLLSQYDRVQPNDVQKINDNCYLEYPAGGLLIGNFRGAGGVWYRKIRINNP